MDEIDIVASRIYTRYCKAVGGKAFNGDPLPTWEEFRDDPAKQLQSTAWREAADEAINLIRNP